MLVPVFVGADPADQKLGSAPEDGSPPTFASVPNGLFSVFGLKANEAAALWEPACDVARRLNREHGVDKLVAFDPMTIMAIIVEVVKMVRECRKQPTDAIAMAKSGGVAGRLIRWKVGRVVRKHIEDDGVREMLGDSPVDAVIKHTAALEPAKIEAIFASVA